MAIEQTLSIIKPDAVASHHIGDILQRFEKAGLQIIAIKMMHLSTESAQKFYAEHRERPFFTALIDFMTSGPVLISVLSGESAVLVHRSLMGETNPKEAKKGTIRSDFATSIDENAVHGSDSHISAIREIQYFFNQLEICPRTR
ncbi:MAG: nucleoside-diphosphate kinase [Endozoicomonadaceae bacterium]|nr:nucleoside-diphosphate kinase [Endozoicomonadaceae bacterium]MBE8233176.1 nucleoside-diphosphate kinase [Endozoicomonadaceae bacterium]